MQSGNHMIVSLACVMAVTALGGCAYVKIQPNASEVEVLDQRRAEKCDKIGQTKVSVAERILFIPRGDPAIDKDLKILARNSGADMGGDTVAPLTEVREGKRTFGVYDCLED